VRVVREQVLGAVGAVRLVRGGGVERVDPSEADAHELLREDYDTAEKLRGAKRLQEYLAWIRGTEKLDIQVRPSDGRRRR